MLQTPKQRELLCQTWRWFMDGTFKIVDYPFCNGQLMSIHGFVKSGDAMKQLPLLFVLMSRRRTEDYVAVLEKTRENLGDDFDLKGFVLDFESAAWSAIRRVFPGVEIKGCVFHGEEDDMGVYQEVVGPSISSTKPHPSCV